MKSKPCEPLPAEFAEALSRERLGRLASTVLFYPTIGSTNDVAASWAASWSDDGEAGRRLEGLVVLADEQTAGRGRHGRAWASPAGSGLYVTVLLMPGASHANPMRATLLTTLAAGVALAEGIEATTGLRADLKWPNDLLVGRRKLAGILTEGVGIGMDTAAPAAGAVIVGFGINVGSAAYPHEVGERATSIETELGRPADRPAVLAGTLAALASRYEDLLHGRFDAILDAWRRLAPRSTGARVQWMAPHGPQTGVTAGIDDHGALLVAVGDRVERIVAGEVTWY